MVLHGVRQGEVVVPRSGHISVLHQRVMEMSVEALLHLADVLHLSDSANADLAPLLDITLGLAHD